jgi:hypothetical protein
LFQKNQVAVIYTRWKNLKKTPDMVEGQVSYHRPENVRRLKVEKNNPVVKQLEATRKELYPDLAAAQDKRLRQIKLLKKQEYKRLAKEKQFKKMEFQREKELRSYDRLYDESQMTSVSQQNATADSTAAEEYEDDFF